jgi:hypothetical protein
VEDEFTTRVMDMTTGETMGQYPIEYCHEWSNWRETGEKSDRLLELEKRYRVRRYKVSYELLEEGT